MVQQVSRMFSSCKTETLSPSDTHSPFPFPQPPATTVYSLSMTLTALGISQRWSHGACVFLWLAWCTECNVLKLHPCCSRWQDFLPLLRLNAIPSVGWSPHLSIHLLMDSHCPLMGSWFPSKSLYVWSCLLQGLVPFCPHLLTPSQMLLLPCFLCVPQGMLNLFLSQGFCTCFPSSLHCLYCSSPNLWRANSSQYSSFIFCVTSAQRPDFSWNRCSILATFSQAAVSGFGHSGCRDLPLACSFFLCCPLEGKLHMAGRSPNWLTTESSCQIAPDSHLLNISLINLFIIYFFLHYCIVENLKKYKTNGGDSFFVSFLNLKLSFKFTSIV